MADRLRLLLMRHAKAEKEGADDFARELTERGRDDAHLIGSYMAEHDLRPDVALCSPAARTRQTLEIVQQIVTGIAAAYLDELYLGTPARMRIAINKATTANTVLMVGHNPGTAELAQQLSRDSEHDQEILRRASMGVKFPTCGLAVIEFAVAAWRDIVPYSGTLAAFIRPKDLKS